MTPTAMPGQNQTTDVQTADGQQNMTPPTMPGQNGEQMPDMPGTPGGIPSDSVNVEYTAAATVTESAEGTYYSSTSDNENYSSDSSVFLDASADSWGSSRNGGNVTLNLVNQDIVGAITSDNVSSVTVNLDSDSTWTLTGDSYVTAFNGDISNVVTNGYTLYVNGVTVA